MLKYYNEIVYYVQKMVGDKESAKDITQEAYTKLVEHEQKNNVEYNNIRAFLYKVARNIVIDNVRKTKKITELTYEESDFVSPKIEQPEEIVVQDNYYENLMKLVDSLPKRSKEAFILHNIDGYSRKEIAQMMGISTSAVEKHIIRATKKLQEKLKQS